MDDNTSSNGHSMSQLREDAGDSPLHRVRSTSAAPQTGVPRRVSTNDRIHEILENAHGRADSLSPNTRSPTSTPLIQKNGPSSDNALPSAGLDEEDETFQLRHSSQDANFAPGISNQGYQTMSHNAAGNGGSNTDDPSPRHRSSIYSRRDTSKTDPPPPPVQDSTAVTNGSAATSSPTAEEKPFWKRAIAKFRTVQLENKGSVARDHLALERTFLAWLRTSLAFASIGIAVTQLFRLNTTIANNGDHAHDPNAKLRHMGKPLGATFIGISILTLLLGYKRYIESQDWVIKGKFPASRGSIAMLSILAFGIMIVSLVVVITIYPESSSSS